MFCTREREITSESMFRRAARAGAGAFHTPYSTLISTARYRRSGGSTTDLRSSWQTVRSSFGNSHAERTRSKGKNKDCLIRSLLWLHNKISATDIDQIIQTEFLNLQQDPELYDIVVKNMIDGPCGP
ncbi:hypothetical protein EVAR_46522_1 [Eumeta japonica]|uniref:Uncharacterized protein n=1 Tax=Eumeta variegata TaxID=151549 RepID=A0A4C1WRN2_EUMVA|nr:hypothetical protein EVAR_46522_1 [Eumeta japonica]